MTGNSNDQPQGPFEDSRCVAGPGDRWGAATIRKVCEDGSFKIEFDEKDMVLMPYWYGVTPSEVSFDDEHLWNGVFGRISPDGRSFSEADFKGVLSILGYTLSPDEVTNAWNHAYRAVGGQEPPLDGSLDQDSTYRLFLKLGLSAKHCETRLGPDWRNLPFRLYWNQVRMGGREPAEVARRVTLDDALAALGLKADRIDQSTVAFLRQVERDREIRLPAVLKELLQCEGAVDAVRDCHSNNPTLVEFDPAEWEIRREMRSRQLSGDCALVIMNPHQGNHCWAVVFDDGDEDARVYAHWDGEDGGSWLLTASSVAMFFWDLAQTGLIWFEDTKFGGGKPVRRTDIGLALDV